jgi:hypothetical protein
MTSRGKPVSKHLCVIRSKAEGRPRPHRWTGLVRVGNKKPEVRCSWCWKVKR